MRWPRVRVRGLGVLACDGGAAAALLAQCVELGLEGGLHAAHLLTGDRLGRVRVRVRVKGWGWC